MKNKTILHLFLIITIVLMAGCDMGIPKLPESSIPAFNETGQENNNQDEMTGVPRVVIIELFNTDGCAASKVINPIIEKIVAEYENTEVILVEQAGWGKYATEETGERFNWYFSGKSKRHTPSVCFNGLNQLFTQGFSIGGNSSNSGNSNHHNEDTEENEEPNDTGVDTTKPVITAIRSPLPNASGWNNTNVKVTFTCEDVGEVQSGIIINTVAGTTLTTEGKDQSVTNTGTCIDAAGNIADPVTVSGINIDKTPPVVTITLPGDCEYALNETVTATWSATDGLSGISSLSSDTIPIDTSSVGVKTLTLPKGLVQDKAGNNSQAVKILYTVLDMENTVIVGTQKWDGLGMGLFFCMGKRC